MIGRKWFVIAPVASLLMSGSIAASKPTKSRCEVAKEWLADHAGNLPTTYVEYAKLPSVFQHVAYANLSTETRTTLWRSHLASYLVPGKGLSGDQVAFVRQVMARLPVYLDREDGSSAFQGEAMSRAARRLFSNAAVTEMFLTLVETPTTPMAVSLDPDVCDCAEHTDCGKKTCQYSNCTNDPANCQSGGDHGCSGECR